MMPGMQIPQVPMVPGMMPPNWAPATLATAAAPPNPLMITPLTLYIGSISMSKFSYVVLRIFG
jgi:hypothetical protein